MALTKFEKDLNIVSALDNEPNDVGGLTSEELKAKFDEGSKAIQKYINETLIPETEAAVEEVRGEIEGAVNEATENLESQLRGVVLGQIPDGTITEEKLDHAFVDSRYTKDETLSADTKEKFGLPATADPDATFGEIKNLFDKVPEQIDAVYSVGDVRSSIRSSIGEKWMLANGADFKKADCPQLSGMRPTNIKKFTRNGVSVTGFDYMKASCIGKRYVVGCGDSSASENYLRIAYAEIGGGAETLAPTAYDITSAASGSYVINYLDPYYVIFWQGNYNGIDGYYLLYTTDPTSEANWIVKSVNTGFSNLAIDRVLKEGEYYILAGYNGTNNTDRKSVLLYSKEIDGEYIDKEIPDYHFQSYGNPTGHRIKYVNGYYFAFFNSNASNSSGCYYGYTTDLAEEFTVVSISSSGNFCDVVYDEKRERYVHIIKNGSGQSWNTWLGFNDDISAFTTGTLQLKNVSNGGYAAYFASLGATENKYYPVFEYNSSSSTKKFTIQEVDAESFTLSTSYDFKGTSDSVSDWQNFFFEKDRCGICIRVGDYTWNNYIGDLSYGVLPSITVSNCNTFIKVKE